MPTTPIDHDWRLTGGKGLADWRGWLPTALELVLVLALVGQAARLVWLVVRPSEPMGHAAATRDAVADAPRLPVTDVFFRQATAASRGSGEALGYLLFGVRSEPGDSGSAILGKEGEQASYAVGREIAPGIVLESVGIEHAVLAANGVRHRLELPTLATMKSGGTAPAALPVGAPDPAPVRTPAANAPASTTTPALSVTPDRPASPPAGPPGNPGSGYAITPGARAALLRPAGLRPGDVVLSVNGRPLDTARLAGLRNELKGQSQLTIQYQRDGKTHTTTLQAPR